MLTRVRSLLPLLTLALVAGALGLPSSALAAASYFTAVGSMSVVRQGAAAAPLPDGRVLVAGGYDGGGFLSSAEVFDPNTNSFHSTGSMGTHRGSPVAAPLPDGRVLAAGGYDGTSRLASAEVFDPATNSFSSTGIGSMGTLREGAAAAPLPDGRVLVAGGYDGSSILSSAEVFDPATNSFSSTGIGSMGTARENAVAAPLPDGRVLVAGGATLSGNTIVYSKTAEVFDPATDNFSATGIGSMGSPRNGAVAAPLPDGRVLVAGGLAPGGSILQSAEVFDPATNSFSSTGIGSMGTARQNAVAAPLPDGRVLVAGGYNTTNNTPHQLGTAEVFVSAPEPAGAGTDFGSQTISEPSGAQPVAITNLGAQALRIAGASLGGANPSDFAITSDGCRGKVLAYRQSCSVYVRFTPGAVGSRSAMVVLSDNGAASPQPFALKGAGVPANSGPQGPGGPQGPKGDTGPRGPAGRDAQVTCKGVKKTKGNKVKVTCKVVLASASKASVGWHLTRRGKTVACGVTHARQGRVILHARLRRGRYTLWIAGRRRTIRFEVG